MAGDVIEIIGLRLPVIKPGDDLVEEILKASKKSGGIRNEDILVLSSKVVAVAEGRMIRLRDVRPSPRAKSLAKRAKISAPLAEMVIREADEILGIGGGAVLTLKGGLLCANAGIDLSNAPPGFAVLLPSNPNKAANEIMKKIKERSGKRVGVVISDSTVRPLRLGTIGQAIGYAGFEPVIDCRGSPDLFGRPMRITLISLADLLASAAELIMGETSGRKPVVIIRGLKVKFTEKPKLSPIVEKNKDLYSSIFRF